MGIKLAAVFAAIALAVGGFAANANAQTPPAALYGAGLEAGDTVTASIGDAECGSTEADASGGWAIAVPEGGACGAKDGETVTFAINGKAAAESVTWSPAFVPEDEELGITLTLAPEPVTYAVDCGDPMHELDAAGGITRHLLADCVDRLRDAVTELVSLRESLFEAPAKIEAKRQEVHDLVAAIVRVVDANWQRKADDAPDAEADAGNGDADADGVMTPAEASN